MDDSDDIGALIEIRPGVIVPRGMPAADESPLERPRGLECSHDRGSLDRERRVVVCKSCHAIIDPFDRLLGYAKEWDRLAGWVRHAGAERHRLEGEVAKLKKEKKRLADAVRRLEKKEQRIARTIHRNEIAPVEDDE